MGEDVDGRRISSISTQTANDLNFSARVLQLGRNATAPKGWNERKNYV